MISAAEELALIKRAQAGDRAARDKLVEMLAPTVRAIARGHTFDATARDDLMQEGLLAIVDAIARFDPARGRRLSQWAGACARGAMRNALRAPKMRRLEPGGAVHPDVVEADHVLESFLAGEQRARMIDALDVLTEQEREVVCLRFGLREVTR